MEEEVAKANAAIMSVLDEKVFIAARLEFAVSVPMKLENEATASSDFPAPKRAGRIAVCETGSLPMDTNESSVYLVTEHHLGIRTGCRTC